MRKKHELIKKKKGLNKNKSEIYNSANFQNEKKKKKTIKCLYTYHI